jgi:hypothetical protein
MSAVEVSTPRRLLMRRRLGGSNVPTRPGGSASCVQFDLRQTKCPQIISRKISGFSE